jgi:hypothetical protein
MGNHDQAPWLGLAEEEEPILIVRVVWIVDRARQRVAKRATRLFEGYTVAAEILRGLVGVPLESEAHAKRLRC